MVLVGEKWERQDAAQDSESHVSLERRPGQAQGLLSPRKSDLQPSVPRLPEKTRSLWEGGLQPQEWHGEGRTWVCRWPTTSCHLPHPEQPYLTHLPPGPGAHPATSPPPFAHLEGNLLRNPLMHRATNPKKRCPSGSITSTMPGDGFRTTKVAFWDVPPTASPMSTLLCLCLEPSLVSGENANPGTRALAAVSGKHVTCLRLNLFVCEPAPDAGGNAQSQRRMRLRRGGSCGEAARTGHCALRGRVTLRAWWWYSQHLLSKRALGEKPKDIAHPLGFLWSLADPALGCEPQGGHRTPGVGAG